MTFILLILFLSFIFWLFTSNDRLGEINKSKKILNDFSSKLEEKLSEATPPIKEKNNTFDLINNIDTLNSLKHKKEIEEKIKEFGIAIDENGVMNFDLDLNSIVFDKEIINFILLRYYLTGLKSFPNAPYFKKHLIDLYGSLSQDSLTIIWENNINKIHFEEDKIKKINDLYHFTHKKNIPSIINNGILTRYHLDKFNINYTYNDKHRWDDIENSISLSISHPNYKMFYKYRCLTENNDWVVIRISSELLSGSSKESLAYFSYLNKAIFCKTNAASFSERSRSIDERKTCKAFLEMFESPVGKSLKTYPYDNQAEILYQSNIPVEFIKEIYVLNKDENLDWIERKGINVVENKFIFDKR